jgi:acetyl esterase/lipase
MFTVDVTALHREVRALGAQFDAAINEATRAIYRTRLDLGTAGEERRDVAYGDHPRHRLDVYLPASASRGIVIFVHGGGFVGGDKNSDGVFYVNVGRWLARNSWTAVLPNYRLAPSSRWPAGTVDVSAVVRWVHANGAELAPQGTPVVVWGQSAGACHVAGWLFQANPPDAPARHVSGVMLMSGFYFAQAPLTGGPLAYFGEDAARYAERSPLAHAAAPGIPVWLGLAELDPPDIAQHTHTLVNALTQACGRAPEFRMFRGHNHVSTVQSLGSAQEDVAAEILRFLQTLEAPFPHPSEGTP